MAGSGTSLLTTSRSPSATADLATDRAASDLDEAPGALPDRRQGSQVRIGETPPLDKSWRSAQSDPRQLRAQRPKDEGDL